MRILSRGRSFFGLSWGVRRSASRRARSLRNRAFFASVAMSSGLPLGARAVLAIGPWVVVSWAPEHAAQASAVPCTCLRCVLAGAGSPLSRLAERHAEGAEQFAGLVVVAGA